MNFTPFHCGFVALVGRSNVGKSTLLNRLLGQKISITADKLQTTRHRILGVHTEGAHQTIYVDTPGLHTQKATLLNRLMNRTAISSLKDVDLVVWLVEAGHWRPADELVLRWLRRRQLPVILAVNKIDRLSNKRYLLPYIASIQEKMDFLAIVPLSAERGLQVNALVEQVQRRLPLAPHHFPADQITDRSQRFLVAEIIREKLVRLLGDELPHAVTVTIEQFATEDDGSCHINALILVERPGQKKIVIGTGGQKIKVVGTAARAEVERLLEARVRLELWVKVKSGWSNDKRMLLSFGYGDGESL